MSTGTWTPGEPATTSIDQQKLIELSNQYQEDCDVAAIFDLSWQAAMKQKDWRVANELSDKQLWHLTILFTRAEAELSGFAAGEGNPAIAFFKILKKRKATPSSDQVRWLKSLTSNRYIPHGPITF